jgi:quinol monooxygenase YgiN
MIFISARVELVTEDVAAYVSGAQKLIEPTRTEKGCQLYAMAVDINAPNVVWISEQWDCDADLFAHLAAPHIAEFIALSSTLTIKDMDVRKYEISSVGPLEIPEA